MAELISFLFSKFFNFPKLLIIANSSIIILLVNYLGNWLIFQIRNLWNFFNWKLELGNFKITNIKITKDELFFYLQIYFFIF